MSSHIEAARRVGTNQNFSSSKSNASILFSLIVVPFCQTTIPSAQYMVSLRKIPFIFDGSPGPPRVKISYSTDFPFNALKILRVLADGSNPRKTDWGWAKNITSKEIEGGRATYSRVVEL